MSCIELACFLYPVPAISVQITVSGTPRLGQSSYSLICDVNGAESLNPTITYRWTKHNGTLTQIQQDGANPEVLSFSPLRLSDAGQYACQATVSSPFLNNDTTTMDTQDVRFQSEFRYNIIEWTTLQQYCNFLILLQ